MLTSRQLRIANCIYYFQLVPKVEDQGTNMQLRAALPKQPMTVTLQGRMAAI